MINTVIKRTIAAKNVGVELANLNIVEGNMIIFPEFDRSTNVCITKSDLKRDKSYFNLIYIYFTYFISEFNI